MKKFKLFLETRLYPLGKPGKKPGDEGLETMTL